MVASRLDRTLKAYRIGEDSAEPFGSDAPPKGALGADAPPVMSKAKPLYERYERSCNKYPIFDGTGAKLYPGRWNENLPVIYCAQNFSLAMLEKLVHSNTGDIPDGQQWIEISIPNGTSYEVVTSASFPNWQNSSLTKDYGDRWLESNRSAILIVPSIIASVENNILINESHPQFGSIETSLNRPVIWDERLFL